MEYRIYVGTYTEEIHFASGKVVKGKGEGLYQLRLNRESGKLSQAGTACRCINPSYLNLSRDGRYLYAANERKESEGVFGGTVSAYQVDGRTGELIFLNRRYTKGADPCYITVHPGCIYVCNYGSGSVASYPIAENGSLMEMTQFIEYKGGGPHKIRQTGAHTHSMTLFESGSCGLVCDLGRDRIEAYRIDGKGHLVHAPELSIDSQPGAGPRHQVFSSDESFLYTVNELDSTVSVYRYEKSESEFLEIQKISTLVHEIGEINTCADIQLSPDGLCLYVSNRGDSTIVIYRVNEADGQLELIGYTDSGGEIPRSFVITPDGKYLVVANQNSDNVVVFRILEGGKLEAVDEINIGSPVCVKIGIYSE